MRQKTKFMFPAFVIMCAIFPVLFIVLTINVINGNMDVWNDFVYGQIALLINPVLTNIMIFMDFAGKWFVYLSAAFLFLIIPKSRKNIGIPLSFSIVVSILLTYVLKQYFAIDRPDIYRLVSASGYGHPSGHITYGTAFIGMCAFLFYRHTNRKPLGISALVLSAAFMLLMGFNRIYLGVHTPTDVIAGYLAGTFVIALCIFILPKFGFL